MDQPLSSALRDSLGLLLTTTLDAVVVMNADGTIADWNDKAGEVLGWTRPQAIGRTMADLIIPPRYRDAHTSGIAHFLQTGEGPVLNRRIEISALRQAGDEIPVELTISPIREGASWVFVGSLRDLTERVHAEQFRIQQALKTEVLYRAVSFAGESHSFEDALRLCLESVHRVTGWPVGHVFLPTEREPVVLVPSNIWYGAKDARYAPLREVTEKTYLSPGEGLPGRVWATGAPVWIADLHSDPNFPRTQGAIATGVKSAFGFPIVSEGRIIAVVEFFTDLAAEPDPDLLLTLRSIGDQAGRVFERQRAEQALRDQAEALETINRINLSLAAELELDRLVAAVVDAATQVTGAEFGILFHSPHGEDSEPRLSFSLSSESSFGPADVSPALAGSILSQAFAERRVSLIENTAMTVLAPDQMAVLDMLPPTIRACSYLAVPLISRSGSVMGGLFFGHSAPARFNQRHADIVSAIAVQAAIGLDNARLYRQAQLELAERQRAEQHQRLLLAELDHRVKNMLAVVTGIASQTARSSRSMAAFNENFMSRLGSLSRAHSLLTARSWAPTPLQSLVEELLAPYAQPHEGNLEVSGSPVALLPKAALAISMILHELVTNATKYGALSVPDGRLFVEWRVLPGSPELVHLTWRETGLTGLTRPRRSGFGSRMIEASARHELGGAVEVTYAPQGIRYEFEFPANQ